MKQFARGARRLRLLRLVVHLAQQRAKALGIGGGLEFDQILECAITLGDQAIAPGFDAVQMGSLCAGICLMTFEQPAYRFELVDMIAKLFGQVLDLPLARDVLGDRARTSRFGAQRIG